jgi:aminoglycoside phosphotransferase (APT) family kinase protein
LKGLAETDESERDAGAAGGEEFRDLLRRDGVVRSAEARFTALTDGVSSEILRVDEGDRSFVVKRALARLKVRDEWKANADRNRYEQMYIEYVGRFLPEAVPRLLDCPRDHGYFAMELLGREFTSWKALLLRGEARTEHAERAAEILAAVHARSAGDGEAAARFDTTVNFIDLRIDPYLLTTGRRHAELRPLFEAEAERLAASRICLVHGDFSPKNMMVSAERFVLLDCEVAWYGDPAFDLAFVFTHLLLKALYHAPRELGLDELSRAFRRRYRERVGEAMDTAALEARAARLLPMILLARVDGKSPVEYLTAAWQAEYVRGFARRMLLGECAALGEVFEQWFGGLRRLEARA